MTILVSIAAALLALAVLAAAFVKLDAARLAGGVRIAGPILVGVIGAGMLLTGRAGLGGMLVSAALAWHVAARRLAAARPSPGRRSAVRTAALEMELDHDTGGLEGIVLAGTFEGRELSSMTREEILDLGTELEADAESVQLVETYLDGRFPGWREDAQPNGGPRQGGAPASGPMTKQEAYQILGLENGASATEIRKAHRRLMQRLHPDLGGTSFLAARINEAKEVLLNGHK
jgi:hypothetical protein